jgi:hypothetical protein
MFTLLNLLIAAVLFGTMVALQRAGRRLGERDRQRHAAADDRGTGAAEGAVYGLLGLLIAFTFSGAGGRYEARQHLLVEEANAIGTAWLRLDLLPTSAQPHLRDLFRRYVDVRIENSRTPLGDQAKTLDLQTQIWSGATAAARESGQMAPNTVLLPALNDMIDITTTREQAKWLHPPAAVFVMLGALSLIGALFAGYGMAGKPRHWLHTLGFAAVLSLALFVIIDYEFPRFGFIRVDATDSVLVDLRRSMN